MDDRADQRSNADMERIKDRAQDVRKDVNALATETVEALRKAVDELKAVVSVNASGTRDFGYAKLDDLSAAVVQNPLPSLFLSFGLGLVVGLWRKRDVR